MYYLVNADGVRFLKRYPSIKISGAMIVRIDTESRSLVKNYVRITDIRKGDSYLINKSLDLEEILIPLNKVHLVRARNNSLKRILEINFDRYDFPLKTMSYAGSIRHIVFCNWSILDSVYSYWYNGQKGYLNYE